MTPARGRRRRGAGRPHASSAAPNGADRSSRSSPADASAGSTGDAPRAPDSPDFPGSSGPEEKGIRLQRWLAAAGVASRRASEEFLRAGRVTVNGRVARLGDRADPGSDEVALDGEPVARLAPEYWILNKPRGVVTTVSDPEGRRTVLDLLPEGPHRDGHLYPVGRLDRETQGLVLMTSDGPLAQQLLHPSFGNEREYQVTVRGRLDDAALARIEKGVVLEDGRTPPARVTGVERDERRDATRFRLVLTQGRKRQIRRMMQTLGHPVRRLVRTRFGPLRLGGLPVGSARPLSEEEIRALRAHARKLGPERRRRRVSRAR